MPSEYSRTLVQIVGTNGTTKANVTAANELQTAEASPAAFRLGEGILSNQACSTIITAPATRGLIVKSVLISVQNIVPGIGTGLYLMKEPGDTVVLTDYPTSTGDASYDFGPGIALKAGGRLCGQEGGQIGSYAFAYGYTVPESAVP